MNLVEDDNESPLESRRLASKYRKKYKSSSAKYTKSKVYKRTDEDNDEPGRFVDRAMSFIFR